MQIETPNFMFWLLCLCRGEGYLEYRSLPVQETPLPEDLCPEDLQSAGHKMSVPTWWVNMRTKTVQ